jgi:hypothetical protein
MTLVLGHHQPGRRAGLSKGYSGTRLLQTINASASQNRNTMPPRAVRRGTAAVKEDAVLKEEEEKDINRPPDSNSSDSDELYDAGDITPTVFGSAPEKAEEQKEKDILATAGRKRGAATVSEKAATNTRSRRGKVYPASSQSNSSLKRKSQEELKPLGTGMFDQHGRAYTTNKKRKSVVYGKASKTSFKVDPGLSLMLSTSTNHKLILRSC